MPQEIVATQPIIRALRRARVAKGLTQAELGDRAHLPQSHLSRIEQGKTDLRASSLLELARLLDLEVMLVPRQLVPAVRAILEHHLGDRIRGSLADEPPEAQPLYRLDEDLDDE